MFIVPDTAGDKIQYRSLCKSKMQRTGKNPDAAS